MQEVMDLNMNMTAKLNDVKGKLSSPVEVHTHIGEDKMALKALRDWKSA